MGRKSEDSGRSRKTKSGGRNEKPRTDWRLAGSYVQSETGFANVIGGGAAASTKLHPLIAFLLTKAAENIRGKTPNQPPVHQMRMVGPIENAGVNSIPKRAVEPTPILM